MSLQSQEEELHNQGALCRQQKHPNPQQQGKRTNQQKKSSREVDTPENSSGYRKICLGSQLCCFTGLLSLSFGWKGESREPLYVNLNALIGAVEWHAEQADPNREVKFQVQNCSQCFSSPCVASEPSSLKCGAEESVKMKGEKMTGVLVRVDIVFDQAWVALQWMWMWARMVNKQVLCYLSNNMILNCK